MTDLRYLNNPRIEKLLRRLLDEVAADGGLCFIGLALVSSQRCGTVSRRLDTSALDVLTQCFEKNVLQQPGVVDDEEKNLQVSLRSKLVN